MRVLLVKISSMGDLIHTLPALTDAASAIPGIHFDWVVEEGFKEIPSWHPAVDKVIPIALRRWRKGIWQAFKSGEIGQFRQTLQARKYDLIIDAQGLMKSAVVAKMAHGKCVGYDGHSIRDPRASWLYQQKISVSRGQHAIDRIRQLFALALNYPPPETVADSGIRQHFTATESKKPYLILLHGTTWATKHWPEGYWCELAQQATDSGYQLRLPWGNAIERERAERIAKTSHLASTLPSLGLTEMAHQLAGAVGVVGVDTGLAHLTSALNVPAVTLYGATHPELTGTRGPRQKNLQVDADCAPCMKHHCPKLTLDGIPICYTTLQPTAVWQQIKQLLAEKSR
jgi:heptosyltransferase-1